MTKPEPTKWWLGLAVVTVIGVIAASAMVIFTCGVLLGVVIGLW